MTARHAAPARALNPVEIDDFGVRAQTGPGVPAAPIVFALLGLIWPGWLLSGLTVGPYESSLAYAAQAVLLLYTSFRVALVFGRGRPDWFAITFWCFSYTWFGLSPMMQLVAGRTPFGQAVDASVAAGQALIVLTGMIAYDLGRAVADRQLPASSEVARPPREFVPWRVGLLAVLAILTAPVLIQVNGGLSALFESRDARGLALQAGGFYSETSKSSGALISAAASVLPFLALLTAVVLRRHGQRFTPSKILDATLIVLLIGVNAILNNPISSGRFWVLTVVLSFVFVWPFAHRPAGVRTIITGFVAASAVVFPYLDAYRYSAVSVSTRPVSYFLVNKTDYDAMAQLGNTVRFVTDVGHTWGDQLLGALLFWVPRSAWPGKPLDTGIVLGRFIHFPNQNLSAPLWAEFYIDFGIVGVIIGFALLGFFTRRAGDRYLAALAQPEREGAIVLVLPVMAMYLVLILRGSLLQAMGQLAVLIMILLLLTRRERVAPTVDPAGDHGS